jgi:NAD(P)-dependent dehydrogenase (short-subunit alcohol dehydrogenase family)
LARRRRHGASKAAVAALTVALAEEVVRAGILVNAVAPSTMDTAANRQAMSRAEQGDADVLRVACWRANRLRLRGTRVAC